MTSQSADRWVPFTDEELAELERWYQSAPPSELADDLMDEISAEQAVR